MNYTAQQEQYCLKAKMLCDYLKTELLMIDNLSGKKHFVREINNLKKIVNEKYWNL